MKLKSIIFLTIIALGTLPLLVLVSLNLQEHFHRHEEALRENISKRSALNSTAFTNRITEIETDLNRLATLHESQQLFEILNNQSNPPALMLSIIEQIANNWYGENPDIESVTFSTFTVAKTIFLKRKDSQGPLQITSPPQANFKQRAIETNVKTGLFLDEKSSHLPGTTKIIFYTATPINQSNVGLILLETNMSLLLPDNDMLWVSPSGASHNFNSFDFMESGNLNLQTELPSVLSDTLKAQFALKNPFVWTTQKEQTIAWLPVAQENLPAPIFWAGIIVDNGNAQEWRRSLLFNIIVVLLCTMLVIFCIANLIAFKVDHIKRNILQGLDAILNNNQDVRFHWNGPQEIRMLADELNALVKGYLHSKSANLLAEQQVRESENKFRKLSSSAQDAIILMDNNGAIAYWNKAAERIFGYGDDEALGQPVHVLLSLTRSDSQEYDDSVVLSQDKHSSSEIIELLAKRKDGSDIPIELSLSSTKIQKQWHAIWIVRDISERKQSEKEAELRRQQLVQADKMHSLGLLVSGVAHEINNPNSIALLNTPMLSKVWQDIQPIVESYYKDNGDFMVAGLEYSEMRQQVPQLFAELMDSNKRIKNIVKDLKDYARKDKPTAAETLDINQIIETAVRLTHNLIRKTTSSFHTHLSTDCPRLNGNKQRLEQVIINLIQNACEALTNQHQQIIVTSAYEQGTDTIVITIQDEGIGVNEDMLPQLTDPFFTTKRNSGGTGLGLSVSAGIIKEHGGTLVFSSSPGEGTQAEIRLPVKELS